MFLFAFLFAILYLPITIFYPTKVLHKNRMPKKNKAILTSNHYTNLDPIIYDAKFVRRYRYMAKIELFKNKLFAFVMRCIGAFPVDRGKITPSVFKKTIGLLNKNKKVFIFPEGTRNKSGSEEMGDVKSGIITFASKGEADIIPMLLYRPPKMFRKNYIIVGEPFKLQAENTKKLSKEEMQLNLERYEKVLADLRVELDEFVESKKKKKK